MPIVPVPAIRDLGTVPNNNMDEATYNVTAENFTGNMPPWGADVKAVADSAKTNAEYSNQRAGDANTAAETAAARLVDVQTAANGAFAAANYKGEWSTLSGALNVPATVTHLGRLWYLKLNLANVASQTPTLGSAYWGEVSRNDFTVLPCPAGSTNASDRCLYVMSSASSVLVLPANPADGVVVAAVNTSGTLTPSISRNGKTILGDAENFTMNVLNFQIVLQYFAAQNNWVQVMGVTAYTAAQPAINSSNTFTAPQNFTGGLNMNGNPVVAKGSNANGEYVRYADGTQICWKIQTVNTAISNSDGGGVLYSPAVNLGSYPVAFSGAAPAVSLSVSGGAGGFMTSGTVSQTTTVWGSYFVASGAARAATNYYISCIAIGRWF